MASVLAGPKEARYVHAGDQWYALAMEQDAGVTPAVQAARREQFRLTAEYRDEHLATGRVSGEWLTRARDWAIPVVADASGALYALLRAADYSIESIIDAFCGSKTICIGRVMVAAAALEIDRDTRLPFTGFDLQHFCEACRVNVIHCLAYELCRAGIDNDRLYPLAGLPRDHTWPA